jgi:hypothetical protein
MDTFTLEEELDLVRAPTKSLAISKTHRRNDGRRAAKAAHEAAGGGEVEGSTAAPRLGGYALFLN